MKKMDFDSSIKHTYLHQRLQKNINIQQYKKALETCTQIDETEQDLSIETGCKSQ